MTPERFTLRSIAKEVLGELNFEKGILYTLKALTLYPAKAIKTYLHEDRTRLVKSSRFLFISVAIATFLALEFSDLQSPAGPQTEISNAAEAPSSSEITGKIGARMGTRLSKLFSDYINLMMLLSVPILAVVSYLLFLKNGMNYAEHLVTNTFVWGYLTYLYIPFIPFGSRVQILFFVLCLVYSSVVFYLLFRGTGRIILARAVLANVLGLIVFPLFISLLALLALAFNL